MNPLSAIRQVLAPEVQSLPSFPGKGLDPAGAKSIGIEDLEKAASEFNLHLNPVSSPEGTGNSFSTVLGQMVGDVTAKQSAASDAVSGLLSGQNVPLHQAVIAMEEASVSFQLMVEVRNKLLESYQELMRMQV
jgi:flagellar hook-basal body complex protein FliE